MTLRKLTAGDGYTYLTRQVAVQDSTERGVTGLGDYYTQRGESPGVWLGSGVTHLPHFLGGPVSDAQMTALFGEGRHPDADRIQTELRAAGHGPPVIAAATRLGSPFAIHDATNPFRAACAAAFAEHNAAAGLPRDWPVSAGERAVIRTRVAREIFAAEHGRDPSEPRELSSFLARISRQATTAVAGYDLTFSPVKSVSALWALAPRPVVEVIERAHADAVTDTLRWLERTAAYTREGRAGVRQVDTTGLLAAAFTHRDSRAGDPDLHTHVAVSNKVQTRQGRWLALDGRPMHKQAVAASERYNTRLEALLADRLGLAFADRPDGAAGTRPVREIVGLDPRLLTVWSQRRAAIDARRGDLAAAFHEAHGRTPTAVEAIALAQRANLETRTAKHEPRSLAEQRATWHEQAIVALGDEAAVTGMLHHVLHSPRRAHLFRPSGAWIEEAASAVVEVVQDGRATWQECHVRAEAERIARAAGIPARHVDATVDRIVTTALSATHSVALNAADPMNEPATLRRSDGSSVYVSAGSQLYTSAAILAAEQHLIEAAGRADGERVDDEAVEVALLECSANGVKLNPGQQQLVRELACSGARVQLALAAAGTGKTAALRALVSAWSGVGPVIGLAPSAAAAAALRDETGLATDTIAKLLHGLTTGPLPDWAEAIRPGALVLVDEASLAGTGDLARLVEFCLDRGASVRLIGDDAQLASVAAGGILRDLADRRGAVRLSQVLRFTDPAEAAASIALRAGDPAAVGFYLDRHRVHVGDLTTATEHAYAAWAADRAAARDALLLAPTRDLVTQLNLRAQTDHHPGTNGGGPRARLADGTCAGTGDVILTRHNERRLAITATDWVKNGDRWTVLALADDGSLRVRHHGTHRVITLPADYITEHVTLGYAATVHTAQGVTADACHLVASGAETRQLLYVGLTRGRRANHLYLAMTGDGDPHTVIDRDTLLPPTAGDLLQRILARDGSHTSATSTRTALAHPATRLRDAVLAYQDALTVAAETVLGPERLRTVDDAADQLLPGLTTAPAWPTLRGHLALNLLEGHHPATVLQQLIDQRPLATATDPAAVLDWRLSPPPGDERSAPPLPWLPSIPAALRRHPDWGDYLDRRHSLIGDLTRQLAGEITTWTPTTRPPWAARLGDTDPDLVIDLALWRASTGVENADPDPVGPPARYAAEATHQHQLRDRVTRGLGRPGSAAQRWRPLAEHIDARLTGDPHWPHLADRLTAAARAGVDITVLAIRVLADGGPLPDEHPAAALWWRLTRHLSPAVLTGDPSTVSTLRPAWTHDLPDILGDDLTSHVLADPAWPALVAAVTTAIEQGWSPRRILITAHELIDTSTSSDAVLLPSEITTALVWRIAMLTNPPSEFSDPDDPASEFPPAPDRDQIAQYGDAAAVMDEHWLATARPDDHAHPTNARPTTPASTMPSRSGVTWVAEDADHAAVFAYPAGDGIPAERLIELNEQALTYYRRCYPASWAPAYLEHRLGSRELAAQAEQRYTPGYAPPGWDHLAAHLHRLGATDAELVAAGLARHTRAGHLVDRFRDHLLFPLWQQDELHGFIARRNPSHDGDEHAGPKYLNTPDTDLFSKGAQLFGLHQARDLLTTGAAPVLVEGPFDALAITLVGAGRCIGVAPLGTALTDRQADQLRPWLRPDRAGIIVATDNDPAGQRAAERAYWQLTARGAAPRHLDLPDRLDPADLLHQHGPHALANALTAADSLAKHLLDTRIDRYAGHLDTAEGTVHAARAAAEIIGALPPPHWPSVIEHAQTRLPTAASGLLHLEVIDAGQAWTTDPFAHATEHGHVTSPTCMTSAQRWAMLGRRIDFRLIEGHDWIPLAEALDRAALASYDVEQELPTLAAATPLPYRNPARELHARLTDACPAAAARRHEQVTAATGGPDESRVARPRSQQPPDPGAQRPPHKSPSSTPAR